MNSDVPDEVLLVHVPTSVVLRALDIFAQWALAKEPPPTEPVKTVEPAPNPSATRAAAPVQPAPDPKPAVKPAPPAPKPAGKAPPKAADRPKAGPRSERIAEFVRSTVALLEIDPKASLGARAIRSAIECEAEGDWDAVVAQLRSHPNVIVDGNLSARTYRWRAA